MDLTTIPRTSTTGGGKMKGLNGKLMHQPGYERYRTDNCCFYTIDFHIGYICMHAACLYSYIAI